MRTTLLASATLMSLALAVPAMAQSVNAPASNINPSDTHSDIAPVLPVPPVAADAGPRGYLRAASTALGQGHTGEAESALERAETRLLDRSTDSTDAGVDRAPMVQQVTAAREALGHGDVSRAKQIVDAALATPRPVASSMPMTAPMGSAGMAAGASAGTPAVVGAAPATARFPETSTNGQVSVTTNGSDAMTTTKRRNGMENTGPGADTGSDSDK
jgi:hypothetical protein